MTQQQIVYLVLVPFIIWRLYSRMRKLIARLEARPIRLWFSAILFPLLILLFAYGCLDDTTALGSLAGGAVCGAALALLGLKLTRFEVVGGKLFYQPNIYIGMALMMLFVTRLAYRFIATPLASNVQQNPGADAALQRLSSSPLTLFIIGMVFCYYAPYSAGILLRRAKLVQSGTAENQVL